MDLIPRRFFMNDIFDDFMVSKENNMKCEYCAGDMSIEDANCPHCGAVNPFYEAHRKDMANYAKRFANTEREVVETTKKFTYKTVVITIISVLVVLNLVMGILLANVRDFTYEMERNKNKKTPRRIEYNPDNLRHIICDKLRCRGTNQGQ